MKSRLVFSPAGSAAPHRVVYHWQSLEQEVMTLNPGDLVEVYVVYPGCISVELYLRRDEQLRQYVTSLGVDPNTMYHIAKRKSSAVLIRRSFVENNIWSCICDGKLRECIV